MSWFQVEVTLSDDLAVKADDEEEARSLAAARFLEGIGLKNTGSRFFDSEVIDGPVDRKADLE